VSRREAIDAGVNARAVLDNPAFVRAVRALEDKYSRAWMESEATQWDEREEAYRALRALNALTDELTILMDNGDVAAHQADLEDRRNATY
jgi:hypothetical protein